MKATVTLTHFARGKVEVIPVMVEGRREWIDPTRPMMRPWHRCIFNEPADEVDALHAKLLQSHEGVGDAARLSSLA